LVIDPLKSLLLDSIIQHSDLYERIENGCHHRFEVGKALINLDGAKDPDITPVAMTVAARLVPGSDEARG
jgi:hypothetical protein